MAVATDIHHFSGRNNSFHVHWSPRYNCQIFISNFFTAADQSELYCIKFCRLSFNEIFMHCIHIHILTQGLFQVRERTVCCTCVWSPMHWNTFVVRGTPLLMRPYAVKSASPLTNHHCSSFKCTLRKMSSFQGQRERMV